MAWQLEEEVTAAPAKPQGAGWVLEPETPNVGNAPGALERAGRGLTDVPVGVGQLSAHAMETAGRADPYSIMGLLDKVRRASANLQGVSADTSDIDKALAARERRRLAAIHPTVAGSVDRQQT
jgi:hypothetical protein